MELFFFQMLQSPHSAELAAASRLEDGVRFYRTFKPDVAEVFHLDPAANRPSLIFMNKEMKKFTLYGMCFHFKLLPSVHNSLSLSQCVTADRNSIERKFHICYKKLSISSKPLRHLRYPFSAIC